MMISEFKFYKSVSDDEFVEVTEEFFYIDLYRHVHKITPIVKKLLQGQTISFDNIKYKIKGEKIISL